MSETLIIAIISFLGTIIGSLIGVITANKLVNYRIEQLETKVEKHNNLIDRMYKVEESVKILEHEMQEEKQG